jgi:hypothetical protein
MQISMIRRFYDSLLNLKYWNERADAILGALHCAIAILHMCIVLLALLPSFLGLQ